MRCRIEDIKTKVKQDHLTTEHNKLVDFSLLLEVQEAVSVKWYNRMPKTGTRDTIWE